MIISFMTLLPMFMAAFLMDEPKLKKHIAEQSEIIAIVEFSKAARDIGPFAGCDDPEALCVGGLRQGSVMMKRQLSGPRLARHFTLRFASLEGYSYPKGYKLLVQIDQATSKNDFMFGSFWIRPDEQGRFCVTEEYLESFEDGAMKSVLSSGRRSKVEAAPARCLR